MKSRNYDGMTKLMGGDQDESRHKSIKIEEKLRNRVGVTSSTPTPFNS
jgi:hypothetical protein